MSSTEEPSAAVPAPRVAETQDQNTTASAEATEKALIEEAKRAGGAAYQFDPAASTEEKDRQVKSTIPSDFHRKESRAVGLSTDLTNGTHEKSSLPPDSKPAEPAGGDQPQEQDELPDEERWATSRTGWAPRFHIPEDDMDEGETLLDHQTFIEKKLGDKFFGDWYHNAGIIAFACLGSWVVALLGGGLGWVFIIMAACATYYRTSIRRVRRNFRDDINREMAKARLETDTESLEWINSFLVKFWPIYAPVLCDSIINSVDQVLSTSTPPVLDGLRMKTFILGTKPPRLEHVKTYPKTQPDIVIMDWKFSFTPNDTLDLTARQLQNKINPKVVLEVRMGKGVVSKGLDVIVEDFAFSGLMRVKVKLQVAFPHIERVDVCFLGQPEIDYVCKPLGGEYLGFDINFIPGLESFIKEQIHGNLAPMMYDPNVFPIEIAKLLAGNPVDEAIGVVAVTIHGAHNLKNTDKFSGSPDPYVTVSINNRNELGRTKTVYDTQSPRWNETIYVIITSFTDSLTLQAHDWNDFLKDKELGTATFAMEALEHEEEHENLNLDVMASGRPRGVLSADVRFFPVLTGKMTESGEDEPPPEMNTGIVRFTVEQAKDLDGSKSLVGQLSPYAVLLLNRKEVHITGKLKRTNNPIFPDSSKEILVTDRKTARLGMMIKDDRDLASDPVIGRYHMKLNDMLKRMEQGHEWFHLQGAKIGRAKMKVEWKPIALKGVAGTAGYVNPIGVMRLHIQDARDLRNVETMGKSDPYLRVLLAGIQKSRTVTWQNHLNPDWDEVIYIPMHSAREKLVLEVMDEESIGSDRSLGLVELAAADYIKEGDDGQYQVDDEKQPMSSPLRIEGRGAPKGTLHYTVAFYPTLNVADPEEEEEEAEAERMMEENTEQGTDTSSRRISNDKARPSTDASVDGRSRADTATSKPLTNGTEEEDGEKSPGEKSENAVPSIRITPQNVQEYESGLIVFKLIEGQLAQSDVYLEVLMDDHVFPSYTSTKVKTRNTVFGDVGDTFVRELEFSKITLRLVGKQDKTGEGEEDNVIAKLTGSTLSTLQQCLHQPTELTVRSNDGATNKITVSLKYIPVMMKLDPKESINNMGSLRVDVLDAAELPSADRNGYSDPYCKFKLDGKEVFKTKVQKKTLHPAWNEYFQSSVKSRIGADLRLEVYDWDFGDKADHLGSAQVNLEDLEPFKSEEVTIALDGKSGAVRLKLLFKPDYVIRSRQGSSTFSGTFATPGKIVGAPVKGVGKLGGGVLKGATFLKNGITRIRGGSKEEAEVSDEIAAEKGSGHGDDASSSAVDAENSGARTPRRASALADAGASPSPSASPVVATPSTPHSRSRSNASQFKEKLGVGGAATTATKADLGTATFTIVSATGYPAGAHVRVVIKQAGSKGMKEVHKTRALKADKSGSSSDSSDGTVVHFDQAHETFKVPTVGADTQFAVVAKDHSTFGSDDVFGEALLFVDDQGSGTGKERNITVGSGQVTVKTAFLPSDAGSGSGSMRPGTGHSASAGGEDSIDSPDSKKARRSFLSKRVPSGVSTGGGGGS